MRLFNFYVTYKIWIKILRFYDLDIHKHGLSFLGKKSTFPRAHRPHILLVSTLPANSAVDLFKGDGPKLVRELFRVAEEHAPSIVFIDEIDAVGTKRYDSNSGGEREIQRTMLELLNQLDGFDSRGDVKVRIVYRNEIFEPSDCIIL